MECVRPSSPNDQDNDSLSTDKKSAPNTAPESSCSVTTPLFRTTRLQSRPGSAALKPNASNISGISPTEHIIPATQVSSRLSPQDDNKKGYPRRRTDLKSYIPKPIFRVSTPVSSTTGVSTLSRTSKPSGAQLIPTTRTEQLRNRAPIFPKQRALNTMTNTVTSKQNIGSTIGRKYSTLRTVRKTNNVINLTGSKELGNRNEDVFQIKKDFLKKQKEFFTCLNNLKNSNIPDMKDILEIKQFQNILNKIGIGLPLSPENTESGDKKSNLVNIFTEKQKETEVVINDLPSRMFTLPSTGMNVCKEAILQKEKFMYDCLSKINGISQSNFENFHNELKQTLSYYNAEETQLTENLNVLQVQQNSIVSRLVSDITHLIEENNKLEDTNRRLSVTQDKYHEELQYKIDLLTSENESTSKKLIETVDRFEKEKSMMEADFKSSKLCDQTIITTRRLLLNGETTLNTHETKMNSMESHINKLKNSIKVKEYRLEKELKKCKEIISNNEDHLSKIKEMDTHKETLEKEKFKLQQDMYQLQSKVQEMEGQLEKERAQKSAAEEKVESLSRNYRELENNYKEVKNELEGYSQCQQDKTISRMIQPDVVEKHKQEINLKDASIKMLRNKINELNEQIEKLNTNLKIEADKRAQYTKEAAGFHTQLTNMHRLLQEMTNEKEDLEKMNVEKTLELEQKDRILHTQTRSLVVRDELIQILKSAEEDKVENINKLSAALVKQEKSLEKDEEICNFEYDSEVVKTVDIDYSSGLIEGSISFSFNSDKMAQLYTMLERKQLMIMRLEKRMKELEGIHDKTEHQRIRHESRINQLEQALNEKCLANPGLIPILIQ